MNDPQKFKWSQTEFSIGLELLRLNVLSDVIVSWSNSFESLDSLESLNESFNFNILLFLSSELVDVSKVVIKFKFSERKTALKLIDQLEMCLLELFSI